LFLTLQIPMALGLAMLVNSPRLRFRNFFRFAFFSAHLVGNVFARSSSACCSPSVSAW
jgi:ABC-type sugar transport system permease subunit